MKSNAGASEGAGQTVKEFRFRMSSEPWLLIKDDFLPPVSWSFRTSRFYSSLVLTTYTSTDFEAGSYYQTPR